MAITARCHCLTAAETPAFSSTRARTQKHMWQACGLVRKEAWLCILPWKVWGYKEATNRTMGTRALLQHPSSPPPFVSQTLRLSCFCIASVESPSHRTGQSSLLMLLSYSKPLLSPHCSKYLRSSCGHKAPTWPLSSCVLYHFFSFPPTRVAGNTPSVGLGPFEHNDPFTGVADQMS